ncbi:MAG TPA: hypothetical protein VHY37_03495 [Tepidisphaeraceae bacterium]|jgi:hypothetical protein|nr:hypothetical protein [Tepidisphaeraceae bacterium]
MHVFTNAKRCTWEVEIDTAAVNRVRAHLKVDLLDAPGGELMSRIEEDIILLVDVLYVLCSKQAVAAGVDYERFARSISGEAFSGARLAFAEELAEFFPDPPAPDQSPGEEDADAKPLDAQAIDQLIDRLAGIVGVNPGPLTLRQLSRMAQARREDEWSRCSHLLAKIHNCNRANSERAVSPDDMNPLKTKAGRKTSKTDEPPMLARMSIRDLRPAIMGAMGKQAQQAGMLRNPAPRK